MIPRRLIPLLPVISGLLLALSWPERGFPLLLFIAFVPLLILEDLKFRNPDVTKLSIYWMVFPAFLIWNGLTTYWIYNSTLFGAVVASLINTIFQSLMFWLFHFTRKNMRKGGNGYLAFIFYWITFEFIHHHWDLNWPWLTLGNGFAAWPGWIQWYEYTGVFGGSLWVLLVNILAYKTYKSIINNGFGMSIRQLLTVVLLICLPLAFSLIRYYTYNEIKDPVNVVVVQPNLDPYAEQYELPAIEVIDRASALALQKTDSTTDFIVFPESMVQPDFSSGIMIWENNLEGHPTFIRFRENILDSFPNTKLIVGYSTYRQYMEGDEIPATAREFRGGGGYYDAYNTAFLITRNQELQLYHKSKLTPGVELMPFPWLLKPLGDIAIDLGGTVGQLGIDKQRIPFSVNEQLKVAPAICYESAYGEFITGFVKNGAKAIFIITNDGWWGNTPGHRQHMLFSVIRSIETRRSIARSANTGISCLVNQRGDVLNRTSYWEPDVIEGTINLNDRITFYVKFGDFIARGCAIGAVLLFMISVMFYFKPEIRKRS